MATFNVNPNEGEASTYTPDGETQTVSLSKAGATSRPSNAGSGENSYTSGEELEGLSGVSSARDDMGRAVAPDQIADDTIIRIGNVEMLAKHAKAAGYLGTNEHGVTQDATPPEPTPDTPEANPDAVPLPDTVAGLFEDVSTHVSETHAFAAIEAIATKGEVSESMINEWASRAGVEPADVQERLDDAMEDMFQQASPSLGFTNNPMGVIEWARENAKEHYQDLLCRAVCKHASPHRTNA